MDSINESVEAAYTFLLYRGDQIVFCLGSFEEAVLIAMRERLRLIRLRIGVGGIVLSSMILYEPT